jgi:hypothetical protein
MRFCERFPDTIARFERFWKGEDTDRPVLFITAPRDEPDSSVGPPALGRPEDRVLPEHMVAQARYRAATTAHIAEGYPHFFVNFGPGILHGCIGGDADFSSTATTWFPRFLSDIEEFPSLRFERQGKWWSRIMACTEALLEGAGDEVVVSITDLGGCADILASAVGTEQLLFDVLERPEAVKAAVDHCHTLWMEAYEINYAMIAAKQDVSTPWWPVVSRGRTYMTQSDFNSMIGPAVFADLFAEELGAIYRSLDNGAFHLDGIGTEVHVPTLVALGNLNCIQWVPEEVETACREFDPRRLMLNVSCGSEEEGRRLVEDTLRWCEGRKA